MTPERLFNSFIPVKILYPPNKFLATPLKGKGKGKVKCLVRPTCYSAAYVNRTVALYNLGTIVRENVCSKAKKRKKSRFLDFQKNVKNVKKNVKVITCIVGLNFRSKYHTQSDLLYLMP